MLDGARIDDERRDTCAAHAATARADLEGDPLFAAMSNEDRGYFLKAKRSMHRMPGEVLSLARIDPGYWSAIYIRLSQFAHASPIAVVELANYSANTPAGVVSMSTFTQLTACLLAKMLVDMTALFSGRRPRLERT